MNNTKNSTPQRKPGTAVSNFRPPVVSRLEVERFEEEDRIDWDRKQKHKREDEPEQGDELLEVEPDTPLAQIEARSSNKNRNEARKKRRQLVYDESSDQVMVKRQRKRQRAADYLDELHEEGWA